MNIQNIHSKQIFVFFLNPEYSFNKIFIFLESRIFIQKRFSFFLIPAYSLKKYSFFQKRPYRPGLSDCKNMHNDHKCQHECGNTNVARTWQQCRYNGSRLSMWPCLARLAAAKNTFWRPFSDSESIVWCEGTFWGKSEMQLVIRREMVCWVSWQKHRSCWSYVGWSGDFFEILRP